MKPRRSWREWQDEPKAKSTLAGGKTVQEPRPKPRPVPETDKNWRAHEFKF